jgi:2-keto-4-pentenoate hydratase/2-oxohepta-3-ene-1,7-dioic acid hydratase in catechol pathway
MRSPEWALVQYRLPGDSQVRPGALSEGTVVRLPSAFRARTLMDALARWDETAGLLGDWSPAAAPAVPGARIVAPLTFPGKVLCSGANYYSHAAEMGSKPPSEEAEPFFFLKPPPTTVIGPCDPVPFGYPSLQLDWEAELGVVIGHSARNVPAARAREHIAGYLAANDLSARDRAARDDAVSAHFVYDWLAHKGQDGFCPLGPGLVPAWLVADPQRLQLRLSVNGVLKQEASTEDMVIGVDGLVAAASRVVTLQPGDVILTGTPAGVGMARGEFLAPGDTVMVEIEGIGVLQNQVVTA